MGIMMFSNYKGKNIEWSKVDKILVFEENIPDFENMEVNYILANFKANELHKEKAIKYFSKSTYYGTSYLWKGGSDYGLVYINGNKEPLRLKLSVVYGVFYIFNYKEAYEINGDSQIRPNRWKALYQ